MSQGHITGQPTAPARGAAPVFSRDSFSGNIPRWELLLARLHGRENPNFLEIGSYEGRSTLWLLHAFPTATITCLDTFEGAMDERAPDGSHLQLDWLHQRFLSNVEPFADRVTVHVGLSQDIVRGFEPTPQFDFIYVDGSHASADTLEDGVLTFRMLKPGGLMIFDDYDWQYHDDPLLNPKVGIDAFLKVFAGQINVIDVGHQVCLERL